MIPKVHRRITICLYMDGNAWCSVLPDFENLQESPAGFGETRADAIVDLIKDMSKQVGGVSRYTVEFSGRPGIQIEPDGDHIDAQET